MQIIKVLKLHNCRNHKSMRLNDGANNVTNILVKKRIICHNDFRDKFNPYNRNNVNNSITLHNLSLLLIDTTIDSNKYTHLVAIRHRYKNNILIKICHNKTLNEIIDPKKTNYFAVASAKDLLM